MGKQTKAWYIKKRIYSKKEMLKLYKLKYSALFLFESRCLSCGETSNLELDHIKPVSFYPNLTFRFSNCQILCKKCNLKKSNICEVDFRPHCKKYELWPKEKKKMFKDLVNKEKLVRPMRTPHFMKCKGTLKDYFNGKRIYRSKTKIISEKKLKYLNSINYKLSDILKLSNH